MDLSNQRVNSTHAWMGVGRSRRTEISSSGVVKVWVGTTSSGDVCFAATVLTFAAAFFFGFQAAGLVAAVDIGLEFLGLAFFLVAVTLGCVGVSVTS